jgi:hypothetical protein
MRVLFHDIDWAIRSGKGRPHRRFLISTKGYLGLGPPECEPGDALCVFQNFSMVAVLKRRGSFHTYVGDAYVHGVMEGEEYPAEESDLEEFVLR